MAQSSAQHTSLLQACWASRAGMCKRTDITRLSSLSNLRIKSFSRQMPCLVCRKPGPPRSFSLAASAMATSPRSRQSKTSCRWARAEEEADTLHWDCQAAGFVVEAVDTTHDPRFEVSGSIMDF